MSEEISTRHSINRTKMENNLAYFQFRDGASIKIEQFEINGPQELSELFQQLKINLNPKKINGGYYLATFEKTRKGIRFDFKNIQGYSIDLEKDGYLCWINYKPYKSNK